MEGADGGVRSEGRVGRRVLLLAGDILQIIIYYSAYPLRKIVCVSEQSYATRVKTILSNNEFHIGFMSHTVTAFFSNLLVCFTKQTHSDLHKNLPGRIGYS